MFSPHLTCTPAVPYAAPPLPLLTTPPTPHHPSHSSPPLPLHPHSSFSRMLRSTERTIRTTLGQPPGCTSSATAGGTPPPLPSYHDRSTGVCEMCPTLRPSSTNLPV